MYHTILVPLDGSKRAETILPHVESLAGCYGSKVILLQVIKPEPVTVEPEPIRSVPDMQSYEQQIKGAENYLTARQDEFRKKGIEAEIHLVEGPVVRTIIKVAENLETDLIAMASHGRTGLSRVFYGSVAAGVLHQVDRPLLLIRA